LVLRFLQGIGSSAVTVLNVTVISDLYKGKLRNKIFGYNTSVISLGAALSPLIG